VTVFPHPLGCVLWFDFGEPKGNIAYDLSGMGNNGTIYGAARVSGMLSGALSLDGVDDLVRIPYISLSGSFSIEMLMRTTQSDAGWRAHFENDENGVWDDGTWQLFLKELGGGVERFGLRHAGLNFFCDGVTPINDGRWHSILAVLREGDGMYLYVDGKQDGYTSFTPTYTSNTEKLAIGYGHYHYGEFECALARIYSRALAEEEIVAHYNYVRSAIVPEV